MVPPPLTPLMNKRCNCIFVFCEQISSALSTSNIYGLGERHEGALVSSDWHRLVYWARDQPPHQRANLYGDHPFLINIEPDGKANGIFLLNANAKEIDITPAPAVTWRTVGGKVTILSY